MILCIADDDFTARYVDPLLGFESHKTKTPKYDLKLNRTEQRIRNFQQQLYEGSVEKTSLFRYVISCFEIFERYVSMVVYQISGMNPAIASMVIKEKGPK